MYKVIILAALFMAIAVMSADPPSLPSAADSKAELVKAGLSESAAAGIVQIGDKYKSQFQSLKTDIDNFIKTQPDADQKAYAAYVEKKKTDLMPHA